MSYSAKYEGGINTVERVFPPGIGGSEYLVGAMPKKGRIARVRVHGNAAESLTDVLIFTRKPDGTSGEEITDPAFDVIFASASAALAGVELPLLSDAPDLGQHQAITFIIGSVGPTAGELAVIVQFEPR